MRIIYVDDEMPAINNFRLTVANFPEIRELHTFQSGEEALEFAKTHTVDAAFLDMEMPGIHGLGLARALKAHAPEIRVVFVTAFGQYALEAFGVDATGYLLKPYTAGDIRKELVKCAYTHLPSHRLVVRTISTFSVMVDGVPLSISGVKPREMLALLIDRGERGFTMGEAIACLWPERPADGGTQSLCRMTWKRLSATMERAPVWATCSIPPKTAATSGLTRSTATSTGSWPGTSRPPGSITANICRNTTGPKSATPSYRGCCAHNAKRVRLYLFTICP